MAHLQKRGKSLMIQRQFARLGTRRLYRSSGTDNPKTLARINDMLDVVAERGRGGSSAARTLIADFHAGNVSFLEALSVFESDGLTGLLRLPDEKASGHASPEEFASWVEGHQLTPETRRSYRSVYTTTMRFARGRKRLADLPAILDDYRAECVRLGQNFRGFNLAVVVCQSWVRSTLGPNSPVYLALREVEKIRIKKQHSKNLYFSPSALRTIMAKLPEAVAAMVWTQAVHGMNAKEYLVDGCHVEGNGLFINGQKSDHRQRLVPLILPPAPLAITSYKAYQDWLSRASGGSLSTHDLRRCYPRWLSSAGVDGYRIPIYQGHKPQDQTAEYAYHAVTQQQLADDAEKLRNWIEGELEKEPFVRERSVVARDAKRTPKRTVVPIKTRMRKQRAVRKVAHVVILRPKFG